MRNTDGLTPIQPIRVGTELRLEYRPPLDFQALLAFFAARGIPGVEHIDADLYARVLQITHHGTRLVGWVSVRQDLAKSALRVRISDSLTPALASLIPLLRRVFDLDCEPTAIYSALRELDPRVGMRLPGTFDGFELAVRAVLGQQVTVAAARTLAARLVQRFGDEHVPPAWPEAQDLNRSFPCAQTLAQFGVEQIAKLGIIRTRAATIIAMAKAVCTGELQLTPSACSTADAILALQKIKGIGEWTAHYLAMRALSAPDIFLPGDVALQNALGLKKTAADIRAAASFMQRFAPWRSYAVLQLWESLKVGCVIQTSQKR